MSTSTEAIRGHREAIRLIETGEIRKHGGKARYRAALQPGYEYVDNLRGGN